MHLLFKNFKKSVLEKNTREFQVIGISNELQKLLGIDEEHLEELERECGALETDRYQIICCNRFFGTWIRVLEITELKAQGDPGCGHRPYWLPEEFSTGTTTTNIPPKEVVDSVLNFLNRTKEYE